ncbi:replication protein A 70 kDa DNA-binding subunit C-like [Spinacia oleracea]|uniref:Replication protein A 70 kDa DNA-binding subunit C-like n=1 Tax=Spinacia oleracea TaxID=3562 RepID=A0A9R0J3E0_SPIOL|nr:replication protein A 70 kDa DNA-binding subunit C-like [Spinacia oleracea]
MTFNCKFRTEGIPKDSRTHITRFTSDFQIRGSIIKLCGSNLMINEQYRICEVNHEDFNEGIIQVQAKKKASLNYYAENITIQARIIRLWTVHAFNNPSETNAIEMVLLDAEGGKIQASIKKSFISKWQNVFLEGQAYNISYFGVGKNAGDYKPTMHPYKINFRMFTQAQAVEVVASTIPMDGFDFKSYEALKDLDNSVLIDCIGYLSRILSTDQFIRDGNPQKMLNIQLEDLQKNFLSCTLWNQYADQLTEYLSNHPNCQVFIAIQYAKIKTFHGVVGISSSLFVTGLHINTDIAEINAFKKSHISQKNENEFLKKSERKHVDEILEMQEVCNCVTLATIDSIELENGWFYLAYPVPRFKLQVRVMDESGSASFVIFDREVVQILGMSALHIRECQIKDGNKDDNDDSVPKDLKELLDRKFLFKVKVTDYNLKQSCPLFTVTKMSDDVDLIKTFQDVEDPNEVMEHEEQLDVTSKSVNHCKDTNTEKNILNNDNENMDDNCEELCITPNHKRSFEELGCTSSEGHITSSEFSTNKTQRKIVVKKEKD